jgi:hypothetical protein
MRMKGLVFQCKNPHIKALMDQKLTVDRTSSTASIASSLYEHVEENGRTYHKYNEGSMKSSRPLGAMTVANLNKQDISYQMMKLV